MNRENVQKVRDHIAGLPPERFNMSEYFGITARGTYRTMAEGSCGSCACIAGHALALLVPNGRRSDYLTRAGEIMGLTRPQSERLFEPNNNDDWFVRHGPWLSEVTHAQAVRVLDHLLETGEVDWSIIDTVTP